MTRGSELAPDSVPKVSFDKDFAIACLDEGPFTPLTMRPEEPAMFLYTSGSTGRPKGVVLSHYSHLWAISQRVRRPVPQGQRSLVAAPLYHMNGLAMCQTTLQPRRHHRAAAAVHDARATSRRPRAIAWHS